MTRPPLHRPHHVTAAPRARPPVVGRALTATVAVALLAVGCRGQIGGEVDGQGVPAFGDGFFFADTIPFFDIFYVQAHLVTYGDACRVTTEVAEARRDAREDFDDDVAAADGDQDRIEAAKGDYAEALLAIDQERLPPEYWTAVYTINAEDDDDVEGEAFSFDPAVVPEAALTLCHQQDYPDYEEVVDGQGDPNADCYAAVDGSLEALVFVDDEAFEARGDAELVESDDRDDDVGDVEVSFGVAYCEDYEDFVD